MIKPIDQGAAVSLAADNQSLNRLNQALQEKVRELEEVNNDLNNLLLSSEVATLFLDPDLRLRRFTPASSVLFAVNPEAIGQPLETLRAEIETDALLDDARAVLAGESPPAREISASQARWFLQRLRPYRTASEPIAGVVVTFTEITASRRAEQRYRETLGRLKRHMDNSPVASMEWDAKGRVLGWSPAAERIFGWSEQDALGRTFEEVGLIQQAERAHMRQVSDALFRGEFEYTRVPVRNCRADGQQIWCEWYNSALHDSEGTLVSVLSLVVDVTERQRLEASLRDSTERLAETDRRKNAFIALLGHELRNPLAPIRSTLDRLALEPTDGAGYACALERVDRQVRHLERLVQDLLDVARVTRGAIVLRAEPQDLGVLVREALDAVAGAIAERAHRLAVDLPTQPVWISGDATRLVQTFTNLLDNAIKYTEPGGRISVGLMRESDRVGVCIADNGRGIASEDLPWLFDAFSRGAGPGAAREGGLGIGLALVRQLVELHRGQVDVESTGPGQGATFCVWLPLAEAPPEVDAERRGGRAEHDQPVPPEAQHVLLVDDEPEILAATAQLLRLLGHQVTTASTGGEALASIRRERPDCVLLDLGLPDTDGVALAQQLADWPERSALRLVALSGYSLAEQPETAKLFDHCLLKPAGRRDFERVLARSAQHARHP